MGRTWTIEIPGPPQAWQRVRRGNGHAYVPDATRAAERTVEIVASMVLPRERLTGPIGMDYMFVFVRPQRLKRHKDHDGLIRKRTRPDIDNLVKLINDGLAQWFDDGQICESHEGKWYAERDGLPRTVITIEEM